MKADYSLKLKLGEREIELTQEEARSVFDALKEIFQKDVVVESPMPFPSLPLAPNTPWGPTNPLTPTWDNPWCKPWTGTPTYSASDIMAVVNHFENTGIRFQ